MNSFFEVLGLLFEFAVHTLASVLLFAMFVGATWAIHYLSRYVDGEFHKQVCLWIEDGLFGLGVVVLALLTFLLTFVLIRGVVRVFRGQSLQPAV